MAVGVEQAIADLGISISGEPGQVGKPETFVNSSAAGGLRMTVHGLTYSMTARAAREAALGAGAIVKLVTAGKLSDFDLEEIRSIHPNIILLAGGVDFGETDIVLANAEKLASLGCLRRCSTLAMPPSASRSRRSSSDAGIEVMTRRQRLPRRGRAQHRAAPPADPRSLQPHTSSTPPGWPASASSPSWGILPTPGAVLRGAELFAEALGDCLVFDVGGATTDVHSVTDGSLEWASKLTEPEPRAKRTVEGDLGVLRQCPQHRRDGRATRPGKPA